MPRSCGCSGGKCQPPIADLTRRGFLEALGVGAMALWGGTLASRAVAGPAALSPLAPAPSYPGYPLTAPRVYSGERLGAVAMPIGGIGTGTIWLDGAGRLRVWQIFNNDSEERVPDSFFAIRVRETLSPAVVRILQTEGDGGWQPMPSLEYEGGYPIARLRYKTDLPVSVTLEAFNPMIPTDTANSSLPTAIFRFRVRNDSGERLEVSLLGALQNAVGYGGWGAIDACKHGGFGRNVNAVVREAGFTAVGMSQVAEPPVAGFLRPRHEGHTLTAPPMLLLDRLDGPDGTVGGGDTAVNRIAALSQLPGQKAVALSAETTREFFEGLRDARAATGGAHSVVLFEDFEKPSYEGWTAQGAAFGPQPAAGTLEGQQPVSGFLGGGLANSFLGGDGPKGRLTSKPFTIEKRYIGFLIGGGGLTDQTCINLRVGDQVVRTATGRNLEALIPHSWDVGDLAGKEARIEIVDEATGGWGHINIDHIVLSDLPTEGYLRLLGPFQALLDATGLSFDEVERRELTAVASAIATKDLGFSCEIPWGFQSYVRLSGLASTKGAIRVLATTYEGDPVLVEVPFGQARLILSLAEAMPWDWARGALLHAAGLEGDATLETTQTGWGTMALSTPAEGVTATAAWTDPTELLARFTASGDLAGPDRCDPTDAGTTANAALTAPFVLGANEEKVVSFAITWHFPNAERWGHEGNHYCELFADALDAGRYVVGNLDRLWERTELYQRTVYQSNLPEEFLDAMTSQSVIMRSAVCWRSADGYFAGYEGAYGCCPLNCTHVWNYAHTHARLFPEIGRNMRVSDFVTYLHPDGQTSHRQHVPTDAFADGHCACIEAALREHQLSPDGAFLRKVYPGVRKAMEWFIGAFDKNEEGLTRGHQWNTYDTAVSGPNTFIGSQYLSALAASEKLALAAGDGASAERWKALRLKGMAAQNEQLWSGRWYIQIPETPPAHDYNKGCHSDQLLGQWWAHQLDLGYLYPRARVQGACRAIFEHNYKADFKGLEQIPRRYIDEGDGGLYMCTWPANDRPDPYTLYSIEVWTGIEYSTAGLMVSEGMIDEARTIVRMARSRYDGRVRKDLNSGGGVCGMGNPFQELECGKFYARAQSSWSLLIASQGLVLDGPEGVLGFEPRWQPEDHRSFFTGPEGWGLFVQSRPSGDVQRERIELRHGKLHVAELVFRVPDGKSVSGCVVRNGDRVLGCEVRKAGTDQRDRYYVTLQHGVELAEGEALDVELALA